VLTELCELESKDDSDVAGLAAVLAQLSEGRETASCRRAAMLIQRAVQRGE
jgi:hypothetical protein